MANKQKNADDLAEIMSSQLDVLTATDVSEDQIDIADAIANMIGKTLKLAALRIAYDEHIKGGGTKIGTLEAR
jgi:hypothetical protein